MFNTDYNSTNDKRRLLPKHMYIHTAESTLLL